MTSVEGNRRLVGVSYKMYFDQDKHDKYLDAILETVPEVLPTLNRSTDVFIIPDFLHIIPYVHKGQTVVFHAILE